jgi:hypothetical protein
MQNSGDSRRGNADSYLSTSLRGVLATKQSSFLLYWSKESWIASSLRSSQRRGMGPFENRGFLLAMTDLYLVKLIAPNYDDNDGLHLIEPIE